MITSDLKKLIQHLQSCNDSCEDALKIRSTNLDESILNEFGINYEAEAEAKTIDLSNQSFKIFKNKNDALSQRSSYSETDEIIVINEGIIYNNNLRVPFFENIFYTTKIKQLLIDKKVISYDDEFNEVCILLSEKMGKLEIGYSKRNELSFFDRDNELKDLFEKLDEKLEEKEYNSFLRDNFIRIAKDIKSKENSFYLTLIELNNIYENANREFELYKNKFSFETFQSDLHEEKEKYIKGLQESLSDFLSKINSLPIQFGVYILLVFRFKDEIIPLIATIVLIVAWSAFSINSLNIMKKSIQYSKRKFEETMNEISEKSGIKKQLLNKDKQEVFNKISDIKKMLKRYRNMVIVFTIVFVVFSSYNIFDELNNRGSFNNLKNYFMDFNSTITEPKINENLE